MTQSSGADRNQVADVDARALVHDIGRATKAAASGLSTAPSSIICAVLSDIATAIENSKDAILEANARDISYGEEKGLNPAMLDRLKLTPERIQAIADSVRAVRDQDDPTGRILWDTVRPNGLVIQRVSVPIGVLGMIYESRPNVTVDAAALCLKSKNAVILRGGSESLHSSSAFHALIQQALTANGLPAACVSLIPTRDRDAVGAMLEANQFIDVMIPRGGKNLIERVMNDAKMPVFGHLEGLCHVYVHETARPDFAVDVVHNAKLRRTGICGAMETLILDHKLPQDLAKAIVTRLLDEGCEIVGDKLAQALDDRIGAGSAQDWTTEYLDKKLSCCVVNGVLEAVNHINTYGSGHTDSILSEDKAATDYFLSNVDSGIVMHNTSTQFADGGEFGMGAEIGIGTGKLHARGPVGLEQLCTYKYIVKGDGQIRP